ncbi:hypothetical protein Agub_g5528, partial [Astrephomene gubernaculifera]
MGSLLLLCTSLAVCVISLSKAEPILSDLGAFLSGPSASYEGVHEVHLRTGVVDVDAEHRRLPSLTPRARRLLQQPTPAPAASPEWGPLAGAQLWLLTMGPELHYFPQPQHHVTKFLKSQHAVSAAYAADTSSALNTFASETASKHQPLPRFADRQAELLEQLHQAGCALVSFLPPAGWLLAVGEHADLAPVTAAFPDIRLAPYGPPELRISPELAAALAVLREGGPQAAQQLAGGARLDELLMTAAAGGGGGVSQGAAEWLLGAVRLHEPARGGGRGRRGSSGSAEGASARSPPPARLLLEVHFPSLAPEDLQHLAGGSAGGAAAAAAAPYHPASAAASDWSAPLSALSPPDCPPVLEADPAAPELLLLAVCPAALEGVVGWLAGAQQVSWVAPRMVSRLHNLVSGATLQTGGNTALVGAATSPAAHPFWMAGLDGRNQTVGCGDSGLDVGNCFFWDPSVPFMQNVQTDTNGQQFFLSATHRKLRYYLAVQDLYDGVGHGTHVSGTLIGSRFDRPNATATDPLDVGTGQAPGAKIAFMDLSRDKQDGVWTPGDLAKSYFNLTYSVGARVHSDSWGSELTAYDSMAAALDRFTWDNPDFVSVFAAGNYGTNSGQSTTVTSPAVAKNCIAAGATLSWPVSGDKPTLTATVYNMTAVLNLAGGQGGSRSVRVVGANFGGDLAGLPANTPLLAGAPQDACTPLTNAGSVSGRVVLVKRGGCYFSDKMRNAVAAGAVGVLVYNDRLDGYFLMQVPDGVSAGSLTLPMGGVPQSTGRWLLAALGAGSVALSFKRTPSDAPPGFEDVASYSSFGPTADGRIKPDIVAPGYLLSAASSATLAADSTQPQCGSGTALKWLQGTSMATPVVAGSALLVRQYFTDGYYPEGRPNATAGFSPSGALVKAVLLGGTVHMGGSVSGTGMPLEEPPSYRQGFGRLSLLHSLPLAGSSISPGWKLQVVDGASLAQGEQHRFCVRAAGGPLRITLAWYDYPGNPAVSKALVNNLDLQVRAAGRPGLVEYGNGLQDSVNTVEQVWYDDLASGEVAVTVSAPVVYAAAGKQPYALVVQGKFSGYLSAPSADDSASACVLQLAVIDGNMSTTLLTSQRSAVFYFSTQDGSSPHDGFECRLLPDSSSPAATSSFASWATCSNPAKYSNLADGKYSFQVRVLNENVATIRSLTVDTTPPVTTLTSSLPDPSSSSSSITTTADNVTFTFTASDVSTSVNFKCSLQFSAPAGSGARSPAWLRRVADGGAVTPGAVFDCQSPLGLAGLSFGDYTFQVMAYDAVNNPETQPKSIDWKIRYTPGLAYARISRGPSGLVANRSLEFTVTGFRGAAQTDTAPTDLPPGGQQQQKFESAIFNTTEGSASVAALVARAPAWNLLTTQSCQFSVSSDGSYVVVVRPQGSTDATTWALAAVVVDTTPPVVAILRNISAIQSDPRVTIPFGDAGPEGEIRAYYCRWLGPSASPPDADTPNTAAAPFVSCSGSSTHDNVTEGYWLFQVKGRDAAGNLGPPTNVLFRTDLTPPAISTNMPPAVAATRVAWNFSVDDGPSGTGIANVSCSFRYTHLVAMANLSQGDSEYPAGTRMAGWTNPCPNPAKYTVQEGSYVWSLAASDNAGLRTTADYQLVVDFTPPVSRVFASALPAGRTLPAKVTIDFMSTDKPDDSPSGVAQQLCLLSQTSAPPPASPPPRPPSPPSPPASSRPPPPPPAASSSSYSSSPSSSSTSSSSSSTVTGRRQLANTAAAAGPTLLGGTQVQLGVWQVCDATGSGSNVTYQGLSTGFYTFSVRAVDLAGNTGLPTPPYFFAVDSSLPDDGSETITPQGTQGLSSHNRALVAGLVVLVGGVIGVAVIVGVVWARRRALRKRYNPPPALPPSGSVEMQGLALVPPPGSGGGGGVGSGGGYVPMYGGVTGPVAGAGSGG